MLSHFLCFIHLVFTSHDVHCHNYYTEPHDNNIFASNDGCVQNIDDIQEPTPSTSSLPHQVLGDVPSGLEPLENALLGSHSSGLLVWSFSDSIFFHYMVLCHMPSPLTIVELFYCAICSVGFVFLLNVLLVIILDVPCFHKDSNLWLRCPLVLLVSCLLPLQINNPMMNYYISYRISRFLI